MSVIRHARRIVFAALAWTLFALAVPAFAQQKDDKVTVPPDSAIVVKRVPAPGKVDSQKADAAGANVVAVPSGTATALVYMPPPGVKNLEDNINYTVGGVAQPVIQISVKPLAPTLTDPVLYEASFKAIFVLFILAVLMESGLALLFRWRPFLDYFDSRSMNALIAFGFSLFFVRLFDLDITTSLINVYTGAKHPPDWSGSLITAMIIVGGSAGVNRILQAFGFRATSSQEQPSKPQLNNNQAWIAVTLLREQAVGSVDVLIKNAVAGTILGASPKNSLWRYFVRDKGRFPRTGGYEVTPGQGYEIELRAHDVNGNPLPLQKWGPYEIAPRAIVDVEIKV